MSLPIDEMLAELFMYKIHKTMIICESYGNGSVYVGNNYEYMAISS